MKLIFLIADGMGGWPDEAPGGKTCLEAAETPNMDAMARLGVLGTCRTVPEGMPPGSDVANMALLGFDPKKYHTGRGPIEAAAQGLALAPDDLVWRMNLVTVSELSSGGEMLDYSAGHIPTATAAPLVEDLQKELGDATFRFVPGVQYRHLLVQKGGAGALEAGLHISPPHDITNKPIRTDLHEFSRSTRLRDLIFMARARLAETAKDTRANAIWPWGQGRPLSLPDFRKTFGRTGAVISAVDVVRGLGRSAGMEVMEVPGATGLLDTNYAGKVDAACEFLTHGDFVYLHVEAPDECGHAGDPAQKIEAIHRFDTRIVGPLRRALAGQNTAWIVTCDHFTPIAKRTHTTDPVPFVFFTDMGREPEPSGAPGFTEAEARSAGLVVEAGHDLLPWVLHQLKTGGVR